MNYLGTLGENVRVMRGVWLEPADQAIVKAAYVHRFTLKHRPQWANRPDCAHCKPQFRDDADWLANTFFAVKSNGRLSPKLKHCESHPTWPDGLESGETRLSKREE